MKLKMSICSHVSPNNVPFQVQRRFQQIGHVGFTNKRISFTDTCYAKGHFSSNLIWVRLHGYCKAMLHELPIKVRNDKSWRTAKASCDMQQISSCSLLLKFKTQSSPLRVLESRYVLDLWHFNFFKAARLCDEKERILRWKEWRLWHFLS